MSNSEPKKVMVITGEILPCPKCGEPMAGITSKDGHVISVSLPANERCLKCDSVGGPQKS